MWNWSGRRSTQRWSSSPAASFPGLVIQGDSLGNLQSLVEGIVAAIEEARLEDARDEAAELHALVTGYKRAYEDAMRAAGLELPY